MNCFINYISVINYPTQLHRSPQEIYQVHNEIKYQKVIKKVHIISL